MSSFRRCLTLFLMVVLVSVAGQAQSRFAERIDVRLNLIVIDDGITDLAANARFVSPDSAVGEADPLLGDLFDLNILIIINQIYSVCNINFQIGSVKVINPDVMISPLNEDRAFIDIFDGKELLKVLELQSFPLILDEMAIHIAPTLDGANPLELFREGPHLNMFVTGAPIVVGGEGGVLGVGQLDGRHSVATYKTFVDINDRGGAKILAHEWGHNFGLLHTNEDGLAETDEDNLNLMVPFLQADGFGNARLTVSQCERARTSPILNDLTPSPLTEINVPQDFGTIQAAIDAAPLGATVTVAAGNYDEGIFIDKPVNLMAEADGQVVLNGSQRNPTPLLIRDTGDVSVRGFAMPSGGVVALNVFNAQLEANTVSNADRGILIQNSQLDLIDNQVSDSNIGVLAFGLVDSLVQGNTLVDNQGEFGIGLALVISTNISVIANTISENDVGLFAESGTSLSLTDNAITDNANAGIQVTPDVLIISCSGNDFSGNSIPTSVRAAC